MTLPEPLPGTRPGQVPALPEDVPALRRSRQPADAGGTNAPLVPVRGAWDPVEVDAVLLEDVAAAVTAEMTEAGGWKRPAAPAPDDDTVAFTPAPAVLLAQLGSQLERPAAGRATSRRGVAVAVTWRTWAFVAVTAVLAGAATFPLWHSPLPAQKAATGSDPALAALRTYVASLDGDPSYDRSAAKVEPGLIRRPLGDGRVLVVSLVPGGSCWETTVGTDGAPGPIVRGKPADCHT